MRTMKRLLVATVFLASLFTIGTSSADCDPFKDCPVALETKVADCSLTLTFKLSHPVALNSTDEGPVAVCRRVGGSGHP